MPKIYVSYAIAVVVVWFMNGYALLQHLSLVTEINGFIAATLLANILTAPFVMWARRDHAAVQLEQSPSRMAFAGLPRTEPRRE